MSEVDIFKKNVYRYKNGNISSIYYIYDQSTHRVGGPAIQKWHENGQLRETSYCINGCLHRSDGPATQRFSRNGSLILEQFWFDNEQYSSLEELQYAVKTACLI